MPNLEQIEIGAALVEKGATVVADALRQELPSIFGKGTVELESRLAGTAAGTPFHSLIDASIASGHQPLIETLGEFFRLPAGARVAAMSGQDAELYGLLVKDGVPADLAAVHNELLAAVGKGKEFAALTGETALTRLDVLKNLGNADILGSNTWTGPPAWLR